MLSDERKVFDPCSTCLLPVYPLHAPTRFAAPPRRLVAIVACHVPVEVWNQYCNGQ